MGHGVKKAHKLTQKVLHPRPIERTNVMLADQLFHESTIAALRFHANEDPSSKADWAKTANFLEIIRTWWNILNVKSKFTGIHKRDSTRNPVTDTNCKGVKYLQKVLVWLETWQEGSRVTNALSKETFFCAIQTTKAFPLLAEYLLQKKKLDFVLFGKIGSDGIEARFGLYRQRMGSVYYLSVRQFLEAEKLIRIQSLVKYSNMTMGDIKDCLALHDDPLKEDCELAASAILSLLEEESFDLNITGSSDNSVIYYIAGYVARRAMKNISCQACMDEVCTSTTQPKVNMEECSQAEDKELAQSFLSQVDGPWGSSSPVRASLSLLCIGRKGSNEHFYRLGVQKDFSLLWNAKRCLCQHSVKSI